MHRVLQVLAALVVHTAGNAGLAGMLLCEGIAVGAAIGGGIEDTPTKVLEERKDFAAGEAQACCKMWLRNLEVMDAAL